jgi:hypothetical protein
MSSTIARSPIPIRHDWIPANEQPTATAECVRGVALVARANGRSARWVTDALFRIERGRKTRPIVVG